MTYQMYGYSCSDVQLVNEVLTFVYIQFFIMWSDLQ